MTSFDQFFSELSGNESPYPWQRELSGPVQCGNRLIRIPTGFGKTLGVLATWAWHRAHQKKNSWPRRLVWCLPMRVLVEQTEGAVQSALRSLGLLWDGEAAHEGKVGVHRLMGGADAGQWHLYPECDAVLIGTQDMLLSRALNRGYASPRARWPMEFGLLNQDALWVMDEVQLMDVGLATSVQLQVFRNEDQADAKSLRPCFTWWMSATLQRTWLEKSPDTNDLVGELARNTHRIGSESRTGHLWDDVVKPVEIIQIGDAKTLAQTVSQRHQDRGHGRQGPTLVVLNTVQRAVEAWRALRQDKVLKDARTDIRLIHSRFRPVERQVWRKEFLNREACAMATDRIIVSTQVVEAGVDISTPLLITELAPWPSLVQRFGRCARWGGAGQVVVADFKHDNDKKSAPYSVDVLGASRDALSELQDVGPLHLERYEEEHEDLLPRLYPYTPTHLLLRHELDELFDTSPDLSGADIDISRFIRSGDERDVHVFWAEAGGDDPLPSIKPIRDELCSVPFIKARSWLFEPSSGRFKPGFRAWVWDWLEREWRVAKQRDIYPGQTVLVQSSTGGYRCDSGWDPRSSEAVKSLQLAPDANWVNRPCWRRDGDGWRPGERQVRKLPPEDHADAAEEDESLSVTRGWQTIATHGLLVGVEAERIAYEVAPSKSGLLHLAGRWHDLGKAHPAFQGSIQADNRPARDDIAKAPDIAWPCSTGNMYRIDAVDQRRGFRHELASTLGLFGVLQRHQPQHQALLGPWGEWFEAMLGTCTSDDFLSKKDAAEPNAVEREILDLDADEFDLLAYLVCAHHGKVRMTWHANPADQKTEDRMLRIRGVREGDILPPLPLAAADGRFHNLPATSLDLAPSEAGLNPRTGRSWTERVLNLVERFGPFTLAWLEALLRSADQRASLRSGTDKLLQEQEERDVGHSLDESHRALAQPAAGGTPPPPPRGNSPPRGQFNGNGRRTSGRGMDTGTTRPPHSATRYIETSLGVLSYSELAPLLADRVVDAELTIFDRKYADLQFYDFALEIHRNICADLTPKIAGRWRLRDVQVGKHRAPPYWRVPMLMRNYAADLEARLVESKENPRERLVDNLTFAEGRLLHIHPFEDFNGRVSRLFLIELLYRLELPVIDPAASSPEDAKRYFEALHAYDRNDPRPLSAIWQRRLEQGSPR